MNSDAAPGYLSADDCRLADLIDLVSQKTDLADYPFAAAVEQNLLIVRGAVPGANGGYVVIRKKTK